MSAAPDLIDKAAIHSFLEAIHNAAAHALDGAPDPGVLQLDFLHPRGGEMQSVRFRIGDIDAMAESAISAAASGLNVYVEGRTVEVRRGGRGKAGDTRGVFAFVDDSDADRGKAGIPVVEASFIVETSPGNCHRWLVLDRALAPHEAEPLGRAIRAAIKSDSATGNLTQPYRVAGTPNYPDAKKAARGRTVVATRILSMDGPVWSAEALAEIIPPAPEKPAGHAPAGRTGRTSFTAEALFAERGKDRSAQFFQALVAAIRAGMLPDDIEDLARRYSDGCSSKYLNPDRLRAEIERPWDKATAEAAKPVSGAPVPPTYPDRSVPAQEARIAVREAIAAHLSAGAGHRAIRVSTGVGKTQIAAELIASDVQRRKASGDTRPTLYAVPRHKLGDDVAARFQKHGVSARVFRGRAADNPDAPGETMCRDLPAVTAALDIGAPVSTSCCKGKRPDTGATVACRFYAECAYQGQTLSRPDVWIVPHQLLFQPQAALGKPAHVIIDEGFWQPGLWAATQGLTLDDIEAGPDIGSERQDDAAADVASFRAKLSKALRRQTGIGGVERRTLADEGLSSDDCTAAIAAEWKLKGKPVLYPGMTPRERQTAARAGKGARHVRRYVQVWRAAREILDDPDLGAVSGRLILDDLGGEHGRVRVVRPRGVKPIATQWAEAPTLIMDATLPGLPILQTFYPEVEIVADIEATMPNVTVRQVPDAPTSANKLFESAADRNLWSIRRAILHRFLEFGRKPVLVIAQMKAADWLKASGLPAGIEVEHFNAISGLDRYRDVRLLICIGRTLPSVFEVEGMAGALTGLEPAKTAEPTKPGKRRWYDKATLGIRMKADLGYAVQGDRHPDETAEEIRSQICEGELVQAIGRGRGVNRTVVNPLNVEIWSDVVLPMTVNEVVQWDKIPAGAEVEMLADGIVLESPTDMATCWPAVWETTEAAKQWRKRFTRCQTPIEDNLYRDMTPCGFQYRREGDRQQWNAGRYDPTVVADPRAWLEAKLGPLAGFRIDRPEPPLRCTAPCRFDLSEEPIPFPDPTALPLRWRDFAHHPSVGGVLLVDLR